MMKFSAEIIHEMEERHIRTSDTADDAERGLWRMSSCLRENIMKKYLRS